MPTVTTEAKALRYLAEGRIRAVSVNAEARSAVFRALGSAQTAYTVVYDHGIWSCTCPARIPDCAHVKACALVSAPAPEPVARTTRPARRGSTRTMVSSEVREARRRDVGTYVGSPAAPFTTVGSN